MKKFLIVFVGLVFLSAPAISQTYLRITNVKFGSVKVYDVYINQALVFKLKGSSKYQQEKVVALSDSTIVFANDEEIRIDHIKTIRLNVQNHLIKPFSFVFMVGGIAFFPLNTLNNAIIGTEPIFSETAAYISLGLIGTSVLIKQLGVRRVRINEKTDLKVLSLDFQNLNSKE